FTHWPYALKRLDGLIGPLVNRLIDRQLTNSPIDQLTPRTVAEFNAWHIAPNRTGTQILCDTNHPDLGIQRVEVATGERELVAWRAASGRGSQWRKARYALKEDFERAGREAGALSWMEAKTDTVYGPQWTHPHPSWSADERWCLYDSDRTGTTQVYAVELECVTTGAAQSNRKRRRAAP